MNRKRSLLTVLVSLLLGLAAAGCHFPTPTPEIAAPVSMDDPPPEEPALTFTPTFTQAPTATPTTTPTPTETPPRLACEGPACLEAGVAIDFLIVTRPVFIPALADYINWKTDQGFQVGLVTVEWLVERFPGRHMAEQMKTGLHEIRRGHAPAGILYLLLVGDMEVAQGSFHVDAMLDSYTLDLLWNVPTGFYRRGSFDPAGDVLPSDAYFTEDRDWDPENTGLNPVPDQSMGQGRFEATIYAGRWSVRHPDELPAMIEKTIGIQPTHKLLVSGEGSFYEHVSCCTGLPPSGYSGNNSYACCYIDSFFAYQNLFESASPWLEVTFRGVPEGDEAGGWAALDEILNFDGVISSLYHGNYDCMALAGAGCMGFEDFDFVVSPPLMEAGSCYIGAFYAGPVDTLAESLHKKAVGPAIVVQPGHNYYVFMDNLRQGMPAGEAFWRAGAEYVYWPNMMLFLGDPSLPVLLGP